MAATLNGETQEPRPFLYREFPAYGGQQMVRVGDWKGVRQNLMPKGKAEPRMQIELYNLKDDLGETTDVADKHPEIVEKLARLMREQHTPSTEFPLPALDRQ
jgi:arylsulfatase